MFQKKNTRIKYILVLTSCFIISSNSAFSVSASASSVASPAYSDNEMSPGNETDPASTQSTPAPSASKTPEAETETNATATPTSEDVNQSDPGASATEQPNNENGESAKPDPEESIPPQPTDDVNDNANVEKLLIPLTNTDAINIEVPTQLPFIIDPYEIAGKGQIYSEDFHFVNRGSIPVRVIFKEINYYFKNNHDFRALSDLSELEEDSVKKDICLMLQLKDINENIIITDDEMQEDFSFILEPSLSDSEEVNESSQFTFSITGSINSNTSLDWEPHDVQIEIVYYFEAMETDSLNLLLPEPSPENEGTMEDPASSPSATPTAALPTDQPPVVTPTGQPVVTPTQEPPVVTPTQEPPVVIPTQEPPVVTPTQEPPVVTPTQEPPVEAPTQEPPVVTPTQEPPADPSAS